MAKLKLSFLTIAIILMSFPLLCQSQQQTQQQHTITTEQSQNYTWENMTAHQVFQQLNYQIQTLDENFIKNFISYYHVEQNKLLDMLSDPLLYQRQVLNSFNIAQNPGNYLLLLGKMFLYNNLPKSSITDKIWSMYSTQSRHMLAYFFLKVASQQYENPEAYYFLGLLEFYKLTPDITFVSNLEKQINRMSENQEQGYQKIYELQYNQLLSYLNNYRFTGAKNNFYFSSVLGHNGASLVLANMHKQGLGTEKNCTSALAYYLSIIKNTYVDFYEFRNSYESEGNFQKELYAKKRVNLQKFGEQGADIVQGSEFFDEQNTQATYKLADNYFIGRAGFKKNYKKAAQLYQKLAGQKHKPSMAMLGMCYFKGQGVPVDRKRARVLFQASKEVGISQSMLIAMDLFEIQKTNSRQKAIAKLKQKYNQKQKSGSKKPIYDPIIKYLLGSLIIKGQIKQIKAQEGLVMLQQAAKMGHLMAKIAIGLTFIDGIQISYDCKRAIGYFAEEGMAHPFFMDKFYMAKIGLKQQLSSFSLMKYLELTMVGHTDSFINSLYTLEIEKQNSLKLTQTSWSVKHASQNPLYLALKREGIVPDMHSYMIKKYNFIGKNIIKYQTLQRFLIGSEQSIKQYSEYLRTKLIKICAVTKQNSLMNFYQYKNSQKADAALLSVISNDKGDKLHVLQSRYLLGQFYHKKSYKLLLQGKDHTKNQYKALQQYKRSSNSQIIGKLIFYIQEMKLHNFEIDFQNQLFQFQIVNDLLSYTFVLSIIMFVLYYKKSKKLDQIHKRQLEKVRQQQGIKKQQQEHKRVFKSSDASLNPAGRQEKFPNIFASTSNFNDINKDLRDKQIWQNQNQRSNQPQISEQNKEFKSSQRNKGYMIGSSQNHENQSEMVVIPKYCLDQQLEQSNTNLHPTIQDQNQQSQKVDLMTVQNQNAEPKFAQTKNSHAQNQDKKEK